MKPLPTFSRMNRTESEYGGYLELQRRAGEIVDYRFEALKFRLADNTYYTPDFMVLYQDRIEFHEVKGFWRDDARVKIKVAAEQNPWFRFMGVMKVDKKWRFKLFTKGDNK